MISHFGFAQGILSYVKWEADSQGPEKFDEISELEEHRNLHRVSDDSKTCQDTNEKDAGVEVLDTNQESDESGQGICCDASSVILAYCEVLLMPM